MSRTVGQEGAWQLPRHEGVCGWWGVCLAQRIYQYSINRTAFSHAHRQIRCACEKKSTGICISQIQDTSYTASTRASVCVCSSTYNNYRLLLPLLTFIWGQSYLIFKVRAPSRISNAKKHSKTTSNESYSGVCSTCLHPLYIAKFVEMI